MQVAGKEELTCYVILPYLRSLKPVSINGISFRSSTDLDEVSTNDLVHLQNLFQLFYLRDGFRIKRMMYAIVHSNADNSQFHDNQLMIAHQLLAYLVGSFYSYENATMFTFESDPHLSETAWPTARTGDIEFVGKWPSPTYEDKYFKEFGGYRGEINLRHRIFVHEKERIYPPCRQFIYPDTFDLSEWMNEFLELPENVALRRLMEECSYKPDETIRKIFRALEWYNQSTSDASDRFDSSIVSLATAFETLFDLDFRDSSEDVDVKSKPEKGKGRAPTRPKLVAAIHVLLGDIYRLDEWAEQFYKARCSIVHRGFARSWHFEVPNQNKKSSSETIPFGLLVDTGRRVFRLCLGAMLLGHKAAIEAEIASELVHTEERLREILTILTGSGTPDERLNKIHWKVFQLASARNYELIHLAPVSFDTLVKCGKELLKVFVEAWPTLPKELEVLFEKAIQATHDDRRQDLDAQYRDIEAALRNSENTKELSESLTRHAWTTAMFFKFGSSAAFRATIEK